MAKKTSNRFDQERLEHPVVPAYPAIAPPSFPCRPGTSILIDGHFEGSLGRSEKQECRWNRKEYATKGVQGTYIICTMVCASVDWCDVAQRVTIDVLPDVALLEIFDCYVNDSKNRTWRGWKKWHTLVHVCRKWRIIAFGSPLRLDLRLYCDTQSEKRWMSGHSYPSSYGMKATSSVAWITSLRHSSTGPYLSIGSLRY